MTCFWSSIHKSLMKNKIIPEANSNIETLKKFVEIIKCNAACAPDISINKVFLSKKAQKENLFAIKNYDVNTIDRGYYCSTCDPFLIIISKIFSCNVEHNFDGHVILYENTTAINPIHLHFGSNASHFWHNDSYMTNNIEHLDNRNIGADIYIKPTICKNKKKFITIA